MRLVLPALTLLVGFAAGWLASPAGDRREADSSGVHSKSVAPLRAGGPSGPSGSSTSASRQLTPLLDLAFADGQASYGSVKALMAALATLSTSNIGEFTAFFSKQALKQEQIVLWRFFFSAWGEIDAEAALAFIDERFSESGARRLFYLAVLDTWRDDSPDRALEFAMEHFPTPELRDQADLALEYLRELAKKNPEEAMELAAQLSSEEVMYELTARRISQLSEKSPQAALDALEALEGELHAHAVSQFVIDWAKENPAEAAQWLADKYDPAMGVVPLLEVAKAYVLSDPNAALKWIHSLPGEQPRDRILAEAVLAWAQSDPISAAGWLRQLESKPEYDAAVVALGNKLAGSNPQGVIEEWVPRISDPAQRAELLSEVTLDWQRHNLAEFSEWIERTPSLSDQAKQRLLARELPGGNSGPASSLPAAVSPPVLDQGRDR